MKKHSVVTSLRVYRTTKAKLDKVKIHPKQSYDEVIQKLLTTSFDLHARYSQFKEPPTCAKCGQLMDFETWSKGGQGYCEKCFYEVCAEMEA